MNSENIKKLYEDFPIFFQNKIQIGIGDGWFDLLYQLADNIEKEVLKFSPEIIEGTYAKQVKEKFGTLRVYMAGSTDVIVKLIIDAEIESENICEDCGSRVNVITGTTRTNKSWRRTLCAECRTNL